MYTPDSDEYGEEAEGMNSTEKKDYSKDPWAEGITEEKKPEPEAEPVQEDDYLTELLQEKQMEEPEIEEKKPSLFKKAVLLVLSAILFGAIAGGVFVGIVTLSSYLSKDESSGNKLVIDSQSETANNGESRKEVVLQPVDAIQTGTEDEAPTEVTAVDVSTVVNSVMPAVVAINCYQNYSQYGGFSSEDKQVLSGAGSGIIVGQNEEEVLIVTNNHVIEDASNIMIQFVDDSEVEAQVKGTAPSSDLAVVAVKFANMSDDTLAAIRIARLGDSDEVKIGQMAIAIGNALGYGQSVTVGYISAKNREIQIDNVTYNLIQTDAAINPGNSGGALLNQNGEVIGINSVKYSDYAVEGMGFAIPISNITSIIEELSNREELAEDEIGYLGIQRGQDITADYANMLGIPRGLYVNSVEKDSPADEAGLYAADIIVKIDDTPIYSMSDLQSFLRYTKAGTKVTVVVERMSSGAYKECKIEITLGSRPSSK